MMADLEFKGKIKIVGKSEEGQRLRPWDIHVYFDGKEIPFLQLIDVMISVEGTPTVLMKFIPEELEIELDNVDVFVRRKETYE